jgi:hypothetical protein
MNNNVINDALEQGHIVVISTINPYRLVNNQLQYFYFNQSAWKSRLLLDHSGSITILRRPKDVIDHASNIPAHCRQNFINQSIEQMELTSGTFF